jgi:hypothetical protein
LHNLDFSLAKFFSITERSKIQFRFESFNFSNTPAFGQPASTINQMEAARQPRPKVTGRRSGWATLKSWLAEPSLKECVTAVCIPPGARLRMSEITSQIRHEYGLDPVEAVTFVQLSAEAYQYRDAISFKNVRCAPGSSLRTDRPTHRRRRTPVGQHPGAFWSALYFELVHDSRLRTVPN